MLLSTLLLTAMTSSAVAPVIEEEIIVTAEFRGTSVDQVAGSASVVQPEEVRKP